MPGPRTPSVDPSLQYTTIRAACKLTGCPEDLVREAIRDGRLPTYLGEGSWRRVNLGEVAQLIRTTRRPAVEAES
jgi:excisionase family DNA binding protein